MTHSTKTMPECEEAPSELFTLKPAHSIGISRKLFRQNLDRDFMLTLQIAEHDTLHPFLLYLRGQ